MNWRKAIFALIGGILGFLMVFAAHAVLTVIAIQSMSLVGSSSPTGEQPLLLNIVVPLMIIAGAALEARVLGASWWRSAVAGVAAFATAASLTYAGRRNYSPFNQYETLAFVCCASVGVLVAIVGHIDTKPRRLIVTIGLTILLIVCAILTEGYGFEIALIAWLLLPFSAGLLREPNWPKSREAAIAQYR